MYIYDVITSPEKEKRSTYHYLPGPRDAGRMDTGLGKG
jgi:hypothetical protein